ncbi:stage II sporulation protein M [Eubacterium sp. 1001713B170207_170306_E7]|uniref:stage II sporulation protein M n=1 Tax=Eubacterium sp. 1001713B170207_170306_E7 TaxID=2787097 RepID=UPI00189718DC|nr:stage II sporulation protein M [Eubacterium sp. 1001713B170207_170306_E7]
MNFIKEQYFQVGKFLKTRILWIFMILSLAFISVSVFLYFVLLGHQEVVTALFKSFTEAILSKDILGSDGSIASGSLFFNNLQATTIGILLGFMPFLFLPVWVILVNAGALSIVFAMVKITGVASVWKMIVFGILPHGIFELTALFLGISLGFYICKTLCIIVCKSDSGIHFKEELLNVLRTYLLLIIPLLIVAALIESYLTPLLINFAI